MDWRCYLHLRWHYYMYSFGWLLTSGCILKTSDAFFIFYVAIIVVAPNVMGLLKEWQLELSLTSLECKICFAKPLGEFFSVVIFTTRTCWEFACELNFLDFPHDKETSQNRTEKIRVWYTHDHDVGQLLWWSVLVLRFNDLLWELTSLELGFCCFGIW